MKSARLYAAVVALGLAGLVFTVGCTTATQSVSSRDCSICPTCKAATYSVAVKEAACERIACPGCGNVATVNEPLATALRNYVGDEPPVSVRMCQRCKGAVAMCAECRKMQRR